MVPSIGHYWNYTPHCRSFTQMGMSTFQELEQLHNVTVAVHSRGTNNGSGYTKTCHR